MKNLIGRRELLGAGMGLCAGSALAQSSETARRELGTDALGRRVGAGGRGRQIPICFSFRPLGVLRAG